MPYNRALVEVVDILVRLDLADAATRADRLVIQFDAGVLVVEPGPLGVNRVGEGCPGTVDGYSGQSRTSAQ